LRLIGDPGSDGLPSLVEIEKQALVEQLVLPLNDSM
jgi:hypothetical protein